MSFFETFLLALKNIRSSKMRTFLTMLGIIIGVTAVIVIVGLGSGMQGYIRDSFADMGTDSLNVMIMGRGSSRSVSEEDMYALVEEHSDMLKAISPTVTMMSSVKIGSDTLTSTSATGVSEEYFSMKGQRGVHIVHAGEFHEHDVLVHVVGSGPDELAVQQKCGKAGEHVGVCVPGLYPHFAPDAVGAHDLSDFDGIQLHGGSLLLLIAVVYPLLPGQARGACAWGAGVVC